jgi:hypothetical protein
MRRRHLVLMRGVHLYRAHWWHRRGSCSNIAFSNPFIYWLWLAYLESVRDPSAIPPGPPLVSSQTMARIAAYTRHA